LASLPKHILYTLFTAESWGFAGSQRFVDAISTPFECTNATRAVSCPYSNAPCTFPCVRDLHFSKINFDKIESMLEFQSVSGINSNYSDYFVHVDDSKKNQSLATVLTSQNFTLASSDGVERRLPPSSAMSFLKKNRNIEAAVVTDYRSELGNLYSNDLDYTMPPTESICSLVNKTAKIIYEQAGGNQSQLLSVNCTLVSTMYDCLVSNFSCPFMQDYFNGKVVNK
jgi:hypothetical protein